MSHWRYIPSTVLLILFLLIVSQLTKAQTRNDTLKLYINKLQNNPSDFALRKKIIHLVQRMKPPPEISGQALEQYRLAIDLRNQKEYKLAIPHMKEALLIAPWWDDAYLKLAFLLELSKSYDESIQSFQLYITTQPGEDNVLRVYREIEFIKNKKEEENVERIKEENAGYFIDPRDYKKYSIVKIGNQTWMSENLAYKVDSGCWAYNDDERNVIEYGYLYDWETAKKVCPSGWHLPTDHDWTTLTVFLGGDNVCGGKMKETGIIHWADPNTSATNESGFTILPGGGRYPNGTYKFLGSSCYLWSAFEGWDTSKAVSHSLDYNTVKVDWGFDHKTNGLSIRCLKDNLSKTNTGFSINKNENEKTRYFIDPRDYKKYPIVNLGKQTWLAKNLAYKSDNGCWAYENDESNVPEYGYLYDWETAKKICPSGWHLPTDDEWTILIDYLGGENVAGGKMKEEGTIHWQSPNAGATNESTFAALPGGFNSSGYNYLNKDGLWWSSSEAFADGAWNLAIIHKGKNVYRWISKKIDGLSVRCLKNY